MPFLKRSDERLWRGPRGCAALSRGCSGLTSAPRRAREQTCGSNSRRKSWNPEFFIFLFFFSAQGTQGQNLSIRREEKYSWVDLWTSCRDVWDQIWKYFSDAESDSESHLGYPPLAEAVIEMFVAEYHPGRAEPSYPVHKLSCLYPRISSAS